MLVYYLFFVNAFFAARSKSAPSISQPRADVYGNEDPSTLYNYTNDIPTAKLTKRATFEDVNAPIELRTVSQPKGADVYDLNGYKYNTKGGRGITVYIIDSGMNMENDELSRANASSGGTWRWLTAEGEPWSRGPDSGDPEDHGSCVASKVAGVQTGVAKYATVVMVPDGLSEPDVTITWYSFTKNLEIVIQDVKDHRLQGKAVLNLSFTLGNMDSTILEKGAKLLQDLLALNVVIITGSGNDRVRYSLKIQVLCAKG